MSAVPVVRLGSTGLSVSRLCLGTMTFGLPIDEQRAHRVLDYAFSTGITFIDTADVYPLGGGLERVGQTEEILARWIADSGPRRRQDVVLATKGGLAVGPAPWEQGNSRKHLTAALEASLRRLRTDYVDLYYFHRDDPATPLDETLDTLDALVRAGKVRYVGASNIFAWRLARALGRSETLRLVKLVCVQPRYNLLFREVERELFPLAAAEGLAVVPYNPLAGGMLTGKHAGAAAPAAGTRFAEGVAGERYRERYWHDGAFAVVEALTALAAEAGVSPATLAIAWVLANGVVTAPIVGATRPEQLTDAVAAATWRLPPEIKQRLDQLTIAFRRGDSPR